MPTTVVTRFYIKGMDEPVEVANADVEAIIPNTAQVVTFFTRDKEYWRVPWDSIHHTVTLEVPDEEGETENERATDESGSEGPGGAEPADVGAAE